MADSYSFWCLFADSGRELGSYQHNYAPILEKKIAQKNSTSHFLIMFLCGNKNGCRCQEL